MWMVGTSVGAPATFGGTDIFRITTRSVMSGLCAAGGFLLPAKEERE